MNTTSKRFDEIAVALALIMTGGLWLAPSGSSPRARGWPGRD